MENKEQSSDRHSLALVLAHSYKSQIRLIVHFSRSESHEAFSTVPLRTSNKRLAFNIYHLAFSIQFIQRMDTMPLLNYFALPLNIEH